VHDREHAQEKAPDTAAQRGAPAPRVSAALALQRKIGNRAFGRLIARSTPEDSVELLDPAINGAHPDVEQVSRTFLPYSHDQDGFNKLAEAYEKKLEKPLKGAIEQHFEADELGEINKRVPYAGYPAPADAAGGPAAS
jgi:hypothetical protein